MLFSKEQKEEYKEKISHLMSCYPRSSYKDMSIHLHKIYNINLSTDYVSRVMNEIRAERVEVLKSETLEQEISEHDNLSKLLVEELWDIYNQTNTGNRSKISIIKTIHELLERSLDRKFNAGLYKKQLGNLNINDEELSEGELKKRIKDIIGSLQEAGINTGISDVQSLGKGQLDESGE